MKHGVLADTGPLYAAVDPDDQHHARAQRELKQLAADGRTVLLPYPILLEAYTLILHRLGARTSLGWLREVLSGAAPLNPTPDDYRAAVAKVDRYPAGPVHHPLRCNACGARRSHRHPSLDL